VGCRVGLLDGCIEGLLDGCEVGLAVAATLTTSYSKNESIICMKIRRIITRFAALAFKQ
jgi:hypothetical protein